MYQCASICVVIGIQSACHVMLGVEKHFGTGLRALQNMAFKIKIEEGNFGWALKIYAVKCSGVV